MFVLTIKPLYEVLHGRHHDHARMVETLHCKATKFVRVVSQVQLLVQLDRSLWPANLSQNLLGITLTIVQNGQCTVVH